MADDFTFDFIRPPNRRYTFSSTLLHADEETIVLTHALSPSKPLEYRGETVLDEGFDAVWFLFQGQPYDVARVYRTDGEWTGYYVDVLEPVRWRGTDPTSLEPLVDLFLDLWIAPDGTHEVLDEDELEDAASTGAITSAQTECARSVLAHLVEMTDQHRFPPLYVKEFKH